MPGSQNSGVPARKLAVCGFFLRSGTLLSHDLCPMMRRSRAPLLSRDSSSTFAVRAHIPAYAKSRSSWGGGSPGVYITRGRVGRGMPGAEGGRLRASYRDVLTVYGHHLYSGQFRVAKAIVILQSCPTAAFGG